MNKQIKYSLLIMLALAMMITVVNAPPLPIGNAGYTQSQPYESNPTTQTAAGVGAPAWGNARDGDLDTLTNFWGTGAVTTANVYFTGFTNTPPTTFTIGWVDLKIKYKFPGVTTTSNNYRIEYSTDGGVTWTILQAATNAKFDNLGNPGIRPFVNLQKAGGWTWANIQSLRVRFFLTRVSASWELVNKLGLYDIWLTIYENAPPSASTVVSLQPSSVIGVPAFGFFFIDIYIRGVTSLWGYQFTIHYDTNVLTALDFFSYHIFNTPAVSYVDDPNGVVSVSYTSYGGDLVGFSGDMPLARIYFMVDGGGATKLDLPAAESILSDTVGGAIPHTVYSGWFSSGIFMSMQPPAILPIGTNPIGTQWHELYPRYSRTYTLTSWLDNGDFDLSASDQIDMIGSDGFKYWFHVDQVTITIHWTFKDYAVGLGEAEPEVPSRENTITDPIGTRWHQIYPIWSRGFTITSWIDNGNGVFDPSDQFDFEYDDEPGVPVNAHLDAVSTDIILSQKGEPEPPVPEFPLGLAFIMAVAPIIPLVHLWRVKRRVMKK